MAPLATAIGLPDALTGVLADQLHALAATYDRASVPVWIFDTRNRCVYRNGLARQRPESREFATDFELVDANDRSVGRLVTISL